MEAAIVMVTIRRLMFLEREREITDTNDRRNTVA